MGIILVDVDVVRWSLCVDGCRSHCREVVIVTTTIDLTVEWPSSGGREERRQADREARSESRRHNQSGRKERAREGGGTARKAWRAGWAWRGGVLRSGLAYGLTEAFLVRRRFWRRCSRYCCRRCWVRLGPSVGRVYVLGTEGYSGQNRGNTDWEA